MDNRHAHNKATLLTENLFVTERNRFRVAVFEIQTARLKLVFLGGSLLGRNVTRTAIHASSLTPYAPFLASFLKLICPE